MRYLHLQAGGHRLLLSATQVTQVTEGSQPMALDLTALPGGSSGRTTQGPVQVMCTGGTAIAVDAVLGLLELADDAFALAPWLPPAAASLVDALTLEAIDGHHPWRLRQAAKADA